MKPLMYYSKRIYNWLLDILFPQSCLGCSRKGSVICRVCSCSIRRAERETTRDITAVFDYRDPLIKRAIWSLKYHTHRHIGDVLGALMYESLIEEVADMRILAKGRPILVIPIPLSRTRKKFRGYNQAEVIARSFCGHSEATTCELATKVITKKIDTRPQAKITNRTARLKNIHGAFNIIQPKVIQGRTIIVIDDVTTTGGTITEVIKILTNAGAKKVVGFAVAH